MELPRGITGFRHIDDPPLPVHDVRQFRSHCYAAARTLGGNVRSIETPLRELDANFGRAIVELPAGPVAVLLNTHFPILAFAEVIGATDASPRFVDNPGLADAFRMLGHYDVLDRSQLEAPCTQEACRHLAQVELDEINYWQPERMGDVIFNFWD